MTDDLYWISLSILQPRDRQTVYARAKHGMPQKVTYYARPMPRWEGASIVYDVAYFAEWAALQGLRRPTIASRAVG
jgi:hypothetical protein